MDLQEEQRMVKNWRGRRLLTYRAADTLERIIEHLGTEDGSELPFDHDVPAISEAMRNEMQNAVSVLMRMIIAANDGGCSPQKLRRH